MNAAGIGRSAGTAYRMNHPRETRGEFLLAGERMVCGMYRTQYKREECLAAWLSVWEEEQSRSSHILGKSELREKLS